MIPFGAALLLLVSTFATAHGSAQTDPGRIHFQAGAADYESGDYEHALGEFQRAYELSQRKQLFYNIALSYQQIGDLAHAIEFLGRYLSEVEDIPNRSALERRQANLQRRLDAQRAQAEEQTATERAAEQAAAERAAAEQAAADAQTAAANGSDTSVTSNAQTTNENQEPPDASDEPDSSGIPNDAGASSGGSNVPAIASFIAGGVGVAMAVSFGVMALSEDSRVNDLGCAPNCDTTPGADPGKMDTYALMSDIGTGIAVIGVGLGLVFLLTADDEETDPNRAQVRFAPFASPSAAGVAAHGRF